MFSKSNEQRRKSALCTAQEGDSTEVFLNDLGSLRSFIGKTSSTSIACNRPDYSTSSVPFSDFHQFRECSGSVEREGLGLLSTKHSTARDSQNRSPSFIINILAYHAVKITPKLLHLGKMDGQCSIHYNTIA